MKVIDTVNKTELDLTTEQLVDMVANQNRQVDLVWSEKKSDEDGHVWDKENWTCVDGKRFVPVEVAADKPQIGRASCRERVFYSV